MTSLARMLRVRQHFPPTTPVDIRAAITVEFQKLSGLVQPGKRIAIGVGSRGITHLAEIVAAVIREVRGAGAEPFIIPAMGSHGGATAEGQLGVLASYGVTEATMGVHGIAAVSRFASSFSLRDRLCRGLPWQPCRLP